MIRKQNSEKIFLQPIDQQYDNTPSKHETEEHKKFFDEYEQNTMDYLNMSTDSETQLSRQTSFEDFDEVKLTTSLIDNWKDSIEKFKYNNLQFLKGVIMQKAVFLRGTLNNMLVMNMQAAKNGSGQNSTGEEKVEEEGS
jgi:hypothetical protein